MLYEVIGVVVVVPVVCPRIFKGRGNACSVLALRMWLVANFHVGGHLRLWRL
jgi:hypothetical protein